MRDRTKSRNYSPEGEKFRREHERHREWGLKQRHAEKLRRIRDRSRSTEPPEHLHQSPPRPTGQTRPPDSARAERVRHPLGGTRSQGRARESQPGRTPAGHQSQTPVNSEGPRPGRRPSPHHESQGEQLRPGDNRRPEAAGSDRPKFAGSRQHGSRGGRTRYVTDRQSTVRSPGRSRSWSSACCSRTRSASRPSYVQVVSPEHRTRNMTPAAVVSPASSEISPARSVARPRMSARCLPATRPCRHGPAAESSTRHCCRWDRQCWRPATWLQRKSSARPAQRSDHLGRQPPVPRWPQGVGRAPPRSSARPLRLSATL